MEDDNIKSQEPSAAMFQADMGDAGSEEHYAAREKWIMRAQLLDSLADSTGHILRVDGLRAVDRPPSGRPDERAR